MSPYGCNTCSFCFFFQAEDGIRYLVRSRGLGDVYKRQVQRLFGDVAREDRAARDSQRGGEHERRGRGEKHRLSLIHI